MDLFFQQLTKQASKKNNNYVSLCKDQTGNLKINQNIF